MDEGAFFNQIADFALAVPAWQMAFYIGIMHVTLTLIAFFRGEG